MSDFDSLIAWLIACLDLVSIFCCSSFGALCMFIFCFVPGVLATPPSMPFPDIPFSNFATFIQTSFSPDISLSMVLVLLFSLIENPELLNLHGRQQHAKFEKESNRTVTPWLQVFSRLLLGVRLAPQRQELFQASDGIVFIPDLVAPQDSVTALSKKLDDMIQLLSLNAFKPNGALRHQRKAISYEAIEPVHLICPQAYQCESASCQRYSLAQNTQSTQVAQVDLLKDGGVRRYAFVLSGKCKSCNTTYHADFERAYDATEREWMDSHLNSARYVKLGQSTWADRSFTRSVLNATYSFHASPSAFSEFWNSSVGIQNSVEVTRRHVWQAFVAETVRMIAQDFEYDLTVCKDLPIDSLVAEAYRILGSEGVIKAAEGHACDECSHPQHFGPDDAHLDPDDYARVTMCVVDGIVIAPTVSCLLCF
jgi:hypothetical protein